MLKIEAQNQMEMKKMIRRFSVGINSGRQFAHSTSIEDRLNVNYQKDSHGLNAVFYAVKNGNIEMLTFLISCGATLNCWIRLSKTIQMRLIHVAC